MHTQRVFILSGYNAVTTYINIDIQPSSSIPLNIIPMHFELRMTA